LEKTAIIRGGAEIAETTIIRGGAEIAETKIIRGGRGDTIIRGETDTADTT
jgi:hypothetical protein